MKKVILSLAVALMSVTAVNAQMVLGGSLGVSGSIGSKTVVDGKITSGDFRNRLDITFAPRIGFRVSDRWEIGAALGLNYGYTMKYRLKNDHKSLEKDLQTPDFNIDVYPYARCLFLRRSFFNMGLEGVVDLGWTLYMPTNSLPPN